MTGQGSFPHRAGPGDSWTNGAGTSPALISLDSRHPGADAHAAQPCRCDTDCHQPDPGGEGGEPTYNAPVACCGHEFHG